MSGEQSVSPMPEYLERVKALAAGESMWELDDDYTSALKRVLSDLDSSHLAMGQMAEAYHDGSDEQNRIIDQMRDGLVAAGAKVTALEATLEAMTKDRDLWQCAHDDDCPNAAMVESLEAANRELREERDALETALGLKANHPESSGDWTGVGLIAAERKRQVEAEGWAPDHDDEHLFGELAKRGAALAVAHTDAVVMDGDEQVRPWKMHTAPRSLVIAGALIAAEIDRLQRLNAKQTPPAAETPAPLGMPDLQEQARLVTVNAPWKQSCFEARDERDKLSAQVSQLQAELQAEQDEVELKRIAADGMRASCDRLQAANQSLQQQVDALAGNIAMAEAALGLCVKRAERAERQVNRLTAALEAFAIAFKEPDGGPYFKLRAVAESYGIYADDLGRDRILLRIARAALLSSPVTKAETEKI
jgi:hypothetical protein